MKTSQQIQDRINAIQARQTELTQALTQAQETLATAYTEGAGDKEQAKVIALKLELETLPRSLEILQGQLAEAQEAERKDKAKVFLSKVAKVKPMAYKDAEALGKHIAKSKALTEEHSLQLFELTRDLSRELAGFSKTVTPPIEAKYFTADNSAEHLDGFFKSLERLAERAQ